MTTPPRFVRFVPLVGLLAIGLSGCGSPPTTPSISTLPAVSPTPSPAAEATATVLPSPRPTASPVAPTQPRNPAPVEDGSAYEPVLDPAGFVEVIDNPYWPLEPGATFTFEGAGETTKVEVLADRREVMGISSVVVRDQVYEGSKLVEDTFDWYAQDQAGNVWYMGEDTTSWADNPAGDKAGSWEAGVDGALPGIVMLADPRPADVYRQEYDRGNAEDLAMVRHIEPRLKIKGGTFEDVLVIEEWTPLEPDVIELKYYARGVGVIAERGIFGGNDFVQLVSRSGGG